MWDLLTDVRGFWIPFVACMMVWSLVMLVWGWMKAVLELLGEIRNAVQGLK